MVAALKVYSYRRENLLGYTIATTHYPFILVIEFKWYDIQMFTLGFFYNVKAFWYRR